MCHDVERTGASANPAAPPFRNLHLIYPLNQIAQALFGPQIGSGPLDPAKMYEEYLAAAVPLAQLTADRQHQHKSERVGRNGPAGPVDRRLQPVL